ncbi:MAG TPA: FHA domain-containing protein [Phototrophicaceae bacterium]|nr:FHA domain-containing protein [Phototrophicaceae bacterium]
MDVFALPQNTENLLLYLLKTPEHDKRSIEILHEMPNFEAAVAWLTENGCAYEYEGSFELTLAGMNAARQVQNWHETTTHIYQNDPADYEPRPVVMPLIDSHPLRTPRRSGHNDQTMRYLLVLEKPSNVLPIPVLDGDVLGRDEADITLADEYISGQHCRFSLKHVDERVILCVEDLGSRNGTFLNKRRLERGQLVPLDHGSRLQVGGTLLKIVKIPD